jgi:hypothetical protein
MNVLKISILLATFLKCVGTSAGGKNVVKALGEKVPKVVENEEMEKHNIVEAMKITTIAGPRNTLSREGITSGINPLDRTHPTLESVDPYNCDREAQVYLHSSCLYLAQEQAKKYESASVQKRIEHDYYYSCLNAIWPGHLCHRYALGKNQHCCIEERAFKKGQVLTRRNNQPSLQSFSDGHCFSKAEKLSFIFYAKDKPPMNLDVLKKLPWPEYKDVLAFRNAELKRDATISRSKQQQVPKVNIILDSKNQIYLPFANLKLWVQLAFNLDKYDRNEIERLFGMLKFKAPDVALFSIRKEGTMTHILPLYRPYTLIQPNSIIAYRYNPDILSSNDNFSSSRHSTIIAEFFYQGSVHCLVLEFDLK